MYAYTLVDPLQLVCKHRIVERKAGFSPDAVSVTLRYPLERFSGNARDILSFIQNALISHQNGFSCKALAKLMNLPKSTVYDRLQTLLRTGTIQRHLETIDGYRAYIYQIGTIDPNPIRRSPHYWWKRCPVCNASRRLARQSNGDYLHWCRCGHFQVISKEMVRC